MRRRGKKRNYRRDRNAEDRIVKRRKHESSTVKKLKSTRQWVSDRGIRITASRWRFHIAINHINHPATSNFSPAALMRLTSSAISHMIQHHSAELRVPQQGEWNSTWHTLKPQHLLTGWSFPEDFTAQVLNHQRFSSRSAISLFSLAVLCVWSLISQESLSYSHKHKYRPVATILAEIYGRRGFKRSSFWTLKWQPDQNLTLCLKGRFTTNTREMLKVILQCFQTQ